VSAPDAVVVGGGPAGLAAATWLARYRVRTLVVDAGEHRNRWAAQAHGYLGSDPVAPADLLARARKDLAAYPEVELRAGRVVDACHGPRGAFTLTLDGGEVVEARRIVLATGVRDVFPDVGNFFDHYGRSVFHCPTCDGYEARGQAVVAVGWSEQVVGFALTLLGWASTVTVVTNGRRFEGDTRHRELLAAKGVRLLEDDAFELVGRPGELEGVRLRGGELLPCGLAFFSIAHEPQSDIDLRLGCRRTEENCVAVDTEGATSVPGVYAAGDSTPGLQLVQVAAAEGAVAGVACAQSLGMGVPMTDHIDAERPAAEHLDELGDEIDEIRTRLAEDQGENEPLFIESGRQDAGQPVDDTITPPG
jgi:thioredoxin reductase